MLSSLLLYRKQREKHNQMIKETKSETACVMVITEENEGMNTLIYTSITKAHWWWIWWCAVVVNLTYITVTMIPTPGDDEAQSSSDSIFQAEAIFMWQRHKLTLTVWVQQLPASPLITENWGQNKIIFKYLIRLTVCCAGAAFEACFQPLAHWLVFHEEIPTVESMRILSVC